MLQRLERMSQANCGYMKGESSASGGGSSSGSTVVDPAQKAEFDRLRGAAGDFFGQGPGSGDQGGQDFLRGTIGDAAGGYRDAMSGRQDRDALDRAKSANLDAAGASTQRAHRDIGTASQGTGTAASGRRGIAEGVASADIYGQANKDNAGMEADFQQRGLDRQLDATRGLGGMGGDIIEGIKEGERGGDYDRSLRHLLAFKDLIGGDMGGKTDTTEDWNSRQSGKQPGGLI